MLDLFDFFHIGLVSKPKYATDYKETKKIFANTGYLKSFNKDTLHGVVSGMATERARRMEQVGDNNVIFTFSQGSG